ncbi:MAG: response regulator, partial [Nitrospirota bacterium]|nr:response regulator [Nitrospirota bacterium]
RRNSLEALEEFRRSPDKYDAVITDQTMPNMAGERLASELLKIRSDIPIILCTGFSHTITPERAASLGIRAFLLKPVPPQEMARVLMEVLHNQRKSISAKLTG